MVINIESGGYAQFDRGVIDAQFDAEMPDCGSYQFEKMVSGRYQGGLMLKVVKCGAADVLFYDGFTKEALKLSNLSSCEIDRFLLYPLGNNRLAGCCKTDADRIILYYLIKLINERSAKLAAVNLAAILKKTGCGTDPSRPVCITADGSTFYFSKSFKERLYFYLKEHLTDKAGIYFEIVNVQDATLIGTAAASLMNL